MHRYRFIFILVLLEWTFGLFSTSEGNLILTCTPAATMEHLRLIVSIKLGIYVDHIHKRGCELEIALLPLYDLPIG